MSDIVSEDELVEKLQVLGIPCYNLIHRGDPLELNPPYPGKTRDQYGCLEEILKEMTPIVTERNVMTIFYITIYSKI